MILWTDFRSTDKRPTDGKVWDMYSGITNYIFGTDQAGNYSAEGDKYNREHSFPKSWFGGSTGRGPGTDLFHLYPTDGFVNGKRSNHPFGETSSPTYSSAGGFSKLGPCSYPGYTGTVFEPNDLYKGDFARTYFYMVTCYEEKIVDWYTNYGVKITDNNNETKKAVMATLDGKKYPGLSSWQLSMLMKWAKNDQVSAKERARNIAVAGIQGNRNPFIDYPGLEEYIWGEWQDVEFSYDNYVSPYEGETPTTVSTPTFSLAGGTYTTAQTVTISCATSGATIYYTTDGTTPSASSTEYNAAITISETTTLKAIAVKDGTWSSVAEATYTINTGGGDEPTPSGETLLWESFSGYTEASDGSANIDTSNENLDYKGWSSFTKVFLGKNGCGKLGSSSAAGSMEAKNIMLTGLGVLTFKVLKYSSDTGKLNVTITGATANGDLQVTPESSWTEYTVTLSDAKGSVGIKFATSTKRAYIDDIKLVSVAEEPTTTPGDIVKDGKVDWNDLKALVKILLGITPADDNIDSDAADVNGDDKTNIADVTKLVNMILQNNK